MPGKRKSRTKNDTSAPKIRIIKQPDLKLTPEQEKELTDQATRLSTVSQSLLDKEVTTGEHDPIGDGLKRVATQIKTLQQERKRNQRNPPANIHIRRY